MTSSPYLLDSLYIVGGSSRNASQFHNSISKYFLVAYEHFKPIGVASTGQSYIRKSDANNLAGVIFAANNPNFGNDFVAAIAQQRFWNRT